MKNLEKETVKVLLQENKRLKRENHRLNSSLEELEQYKKEYKVMIDRIKGIKKTYEKKIKEFDRLEKEYIKKLDKIMPITNRQGDE